MRGNRFWEFYLVRYLLGTIFGVVILFYLIINYNDEITKNFLWCFYENEASNEVKCPSVEGDKPKIKEALYSLLFETTYDMDSKHGKFIMEVLRGPSEAKLGNEDIKLTQTGFSILAAIIIAISGFLYMYFSSMLILIMHGLRVVLFSFLFRIKDGSLIWSSILSYCLLAQRLLIIFIVILILLSWRGVVDIPLALYHIVAVLLFSSLLTGFVIKRDYVQRFYEELSDYRTRGFKQMSIRQKKGKEKKSTSKQEKYVNDSSDYVESYKHLREHGNAFGIIVCELVFAFWLISWKFSPWAIFYWCLIGFLAWIVGTYLELGKTRKVI